MLLFGPDVIKTQTAKQPLSNLDRSLY